MAAYLISLMTNEVGKFIAIPASIALIFMFVKIIFGAAKLNAEAMLYLLKLFFIIAITQDAPLLISWYDTAVSVSSSMATILGNAVDDARGGVGTFSGTCSNLISITTPPGITAPSPATVNAFQQFDCLFYAMIGTANANGAGGVLGSTTSFIGISAIVVGLFFSGSLGVFVTMIAISTVIAFLVAIAQSILIYMTAVFALAFLFGMAPFMVVFILFEPTKKLFTEWVKYIIAYTLQPAVLTAFLYMTLSVLNVVLTDMHTIYTEAYAAHSDPTKQNSMSLLKIAPDSIDVVATTKSDGKISSSGFMTVLHTAANTVVAVFKKLKATVVGKLEGMVTITAIVLDSGVIKKFIALILTAFILLLFMISFLKQLPTLLDRLVSKGVVLSLPQFADTAKTIENVGNKISKGAHTLGRNVGPGK